MKNLKILLAIAVLAASCENVRENNSASGSERVDDIGTVNGGTEVVDEDNYFTDWDANQDNRLDLDEYNRGWEDEDGLFSDWDGNDDDYIDNNEFNDGIFGLYDGDNDNRIADNEWNDNDFFDDQVDGEFANWDADGDGWIDEDEWTDSTRDMDYFADYDMDDDDRLARGEFNTLSYGAWDADGDNYLTEEEFEDGYEMWIY